MAELAATTAPTAAAPTQAPAVRPPSRYASHRCGPRPCGCSDAERETKAGRGQAPSQPPQATVQHEPSPGPTRPLRGIAPPVVGHASFLGRQPRTLDDLPAAPGAASIAAGSDPLEHQAHAEADRLVGSRGGPEVRLETAPGTIGAAVAAGPGRPLEPSAREWFEARFGRGLGTVRIHTDHAANEAAGRIGAAAYTIGTHIVFGRDSFAPGTRRGAWLLAHELTHVAQHADTGMPATIHRAPEDVPALDQKLYDGVRAGGSEGFKRAAEALNFFADFDIKRRLSDDPGAGRPKLAKGQIAAIHAAALAHPTLGPSSNAATFTRPAYLDLNFDNERGNNNWQGAAFYVNAFNDADMSVRLAKLTRLELMSLQVGALQNPQVGPGSNLARKLPAAITVAAQATVDLAIAEGQRKGDLTPAVSNVGNGPPGSIQSIDVGGGGVVVARGDRDVLESGRDWSTDAAYIDQNIARVSYNLYTGPEMQVDYADGSQIAVDLDQVKAGAAVAAPAIPGFFRNKANHRIYPTSFTRATIPILTACAMEILRKEPEARQRSLEAWIDVAVAAHGVGTATLRANQAIAGGSGGKPTKKATSDEGGKGGSKAGTGGPGEADTGGGATRSGSGGGGGRDKGGSAAGTGQTDTSGGAAAKKAPGGGDTGGGGSTAAEGQDLSASGSGKGGGGAQAGKGGQGGQGETQQVSPSGGKGSPPPEGLPPESFKDPGVAFKAGFKWTQLSAGDVAAAGTKLGSGTVVVFDSTASVVGRTATVAEGPVMVGGWQLLKALVVSGGTVVPQAAAGVGRRVLYALILKDSVYLILSSAPGADQPAQAPGKDKGSVTTPGKDDSAVSTPGRDAKPPSVADPTTREAVEAPGPLVDEPAECKKLVGTKVTHDHHVFPQKFRKTFAELDIPIDDYTITMRWDAHVGTGGVHVAMDWNGLWDEFFDDMPEVSTMTHQQALGWQRRALNFGFRLMVEAGIDRRRVHPWGK